MTDTIDLSAISSPKKKRKPKVSFKYPVVAIVWDDAETAGGWEEVPDELKPALATSLGFLIKESENHVLIASSYDNHQTNSRIQIPKGMIKEMTIVIDNDPKPQKV